MNDKKNELSPQNLRDGPQSDNSLVGIDLPLLTEQIKEEKEAKFIYGNVRHYKRLDKPEEFTIYDGRFDGEKLLKKNICHQSIFYHRSLFPQFGLFNTKYKFKADWDFNLRCFNLVDPRYCDVIVSNFYAGGRSAKFLDEDFHNDLLTNMIFLYPYDYKGEFFKVHRKMIARVAADRLRQLNLRQAFKACRILLYHLIKPSSALK